MAACSMPFPPMCGTSLENSYQGESAKLLEAAADPHSDRTYEFGLNTEATPWTIETRPMLTQIAHEISSGRSPGVSRGFHDSVALIIESVCRKLGENGVDRVCLSGDTFQNLTLLKKSADLLRAKGFRVFLHFPVPPFDGGLSLGQAVIAAAHADAIVKGVDRNVSRDSR